MPALLHLFDTNDLLIGLAISALRLVCPMAVVGLVVWYCTRPKPR